MERLQHNHAAGHIFQKATTTRVNFQSPVNSALLQYVPKPDLLHAVLMMS